MVTNFDGRTAHRFRCTNFQVSFLYIQYSCIIQYTIIIDVGVSAHAVAGSLAWIRMQYPTCTR